MGWGSGTSYFDVPLDLMLEYVPEDKRKEVVEALYNHVRDGDWDTVDESAYWDLLVEYDIDGYGKYKMTYVQRAIETLSERLSLPNELMDLYTLLVLVKGEETTLKDVHDAWAIWKNRIRPDHHSIIPFEELTEEVQQLDKKYADAIIETAYELED
ncbi:hypothetical protein SEA_STARPLATINUM_235 [Streptomyces phage StarPlatinum]|uniref:DUF7701 domain-containing protein n=1 Tax=Streptomyces phage StarPlatinum TaxID=2283265 RepID=A0A345M8W8_9CAUD|nr:hypothetical protein HWB77_gp097 [Streptomyces phage StarPlatinum]AXH66939.1 hypothetical protein SEA_STARPLATINUM_235 [Streptomyces phage StarPlatinum]